MEKRFKILYGMSIPKKVCISLENSTLPSQLKRLSEASGETLGIFHSESPFGVVGIVVYETNYDPDRVGELEVDTEQLPDITDGSTIHSLVMNAIGRTLKEIIAVTVRDKEQSNMTREEFERINPEYALPEDIMLNITYMIN